MTICERLFQTMSDRNKRPADLCKILGIGTGVTTGWKKRNTDPPAKYLVQICEFLDVSLEYLLTGCDTSLAVNKEEQELISMYRSLSPTKQEFIYDSIKAAYNRVQNERSEKSSS